MTKEMYLPMDIIKEAENNIEFTRGMEAAGLVPEIWMRALTAIADRVNTWEPGNKPKAYKDNTQAFLVAAKELRAAARAYIDSPELFYGEYDPKKYEPPHPQASSYSKFYALLSAKTETAHIDQKEGAISLEDFLGNVIESVRSRIDLLNHGAFIPGYSEKRTKKDTRDPYVIRTVGYWLVRLIPKDKRKDSKANRIGCIVCKFFGVETDPEEFREINALRR